jgi:beta-phosphoglucomutase-like phosphatase (HAD superfamily)
VNQLGAVVFGGSGVLADTARVHAAAWKRSLDEYLRRQRRELGLALRPFDVRADYFRHVDGRPGPVGVATFLASRGIPDRRYDGRDGQVHRALADRATAYFLAEIERYGVAAFPATVALVQEVRSRGARAAAVCPSRTAARVFAAARVQWLFDVHVHGNGHHVGDEPDGHDSVQAVPALALEAARRLGLAPAEVAVVDDSLAGVEAARRNGFAYVVAVEPGDVPERADRTEQLLAAGAHIVVRSLAELEVTGRRAERAG